MPAPAPGNPLAPPAGGHSTKRLVVVASIALAIGVGIGAAAGSSTKTTSAAPTVTSVASPMPASNSIPAYTPPPSPSPAPPAKPQGKYGLASCDWNSGPGLSAGEFVGSTKVENVGSVSFDAVVTFAWVMGDGSKLAAAPKSVTLKPGANRLVYFSHPATTTLVGNFQSNPGYYHGKNCATKVAIK